MTGIWAVCLASSSASRKKTHKRKIRLLRSVFCERPPVLLFEYEPSCMASPRDLSRILSDEDLQAEGFVSLPKMYFCLEETADCHEYKAVVNTLQHGGLYRTAVGSDKCCLFWGDHPKSDMVRRLNPFQKTNHFPGSWHLGRKDLLWKNVHRMQRKFPCHFDFVPASFVLPGDFQSWVSAREQSPGAYWIYKPVAAACGRGIRLYGSKVTAADDRKLQQKSGIVQRYLDQPLLLNGFKFDLRVYVVITSLDPLKVYLNPEGLVRLATEPYSLSRDNLGHRTMHLTNYSVNKVAEAYVQNSDSRSHESLTGRSRRQPSTDAAVNGSGEVEEDGSDKEEGGDNVGERAEAHFSKWSFSQLREHLAALGQDYDGMMRRIKDIIIKTVIAVETPMVNACSQGANFSTIGLAPRVGPNQTSFEVYGFDVMVDNLLKPWLLEVNVFPSFASSSPLDRRIKTQLIADALTLVGFHPFDYELVERTMKDDGARRLQGLMPRKVAISRSHSVQSIGSIACLRDLGEGEWSIILDAHDEYMRRGMLERIYPSLESTDQYLEFFGTLRYANHVLNCWMAAGGERCFREEHRAQVPAWLPNLVCLDSC